MRAARLLGRLRRAADTGPDGTDAGLLARFAAAGDGDAFAELVRRHGPMVRGVCRRVLGNHADADDAFQAAFLVLARKAGAIRERQSVANWLFGVARRVAARARDKDRRRARHERRAGAERDGTTRPREAPELLGVLDAELEQLPERFRAPVVVCLVQGRTQEDGARELGWTLSTLRRRLDRGRDLLRTRLTRRGFGAGLAALGGTAAETVGTDVIDQTRRAAAAFVTGTPVAAPAAELAEGVLTMMARSTFRAVAAAALVAGLVGGAVWQLGAAVPLQEGSPKKAESPPDPPAAKDGKKATKEPAAKDAPADGRIRPGDRLHIVLPKSFPEEPVNGVYRVEASGKVPLGPLYGRVAVGGLTVEEAEKAIFTELKKVLVDPTNMVTFAEPEESRLRELENRVRKLEAQVEELKRAADVRRK